MNFFIYLVTNSFQLDLHLWNKSALTPNEKIEFLIKKYWLLIKHMILKQKYVSGLSECTFKGKKVYYDSYYGFAGFQRILSSHNNILGGAGVGKANIIIDVGANVGFFSLFMTYKFPSAKIYSFEPVPAAFEALNKNAQNYNNITPVNAAVSDKSGKVNMFEDPISALSHVVEKKEEDTVTVEAITLDEYCAKEHLEIIDILKIDAEMHEKNILLGAAQTLAKTKYLFLELTLRDHENYTFSEVLSLLHKERYSYQLIGFRNMAGLPEGEIPIVELLLQNKKFKAS